MKNYEKLNYVHQTEYENNLTDNLANPSNNQKNREIIKLVFLAAQNIF